uniref:Uncharacterized protein n=1 Tax=Haptolina brevifila TaxID=156173 RepID=A0A7S2HS93_9EUKA
MSALDDEGDEDFSSFGVAATPENVSAGAAVGALGEDDDSDDDFSDFGVPARPAAVVKGTGGDDDDDDDDDDDEFSEFAVPAATSVPIGDFDASPKTTTGGAFAQPEVSESIVSTGTELEKTQPVLPPAGTGDTPQSEFDSAAQVLADSNPVVTDPTFEVASAAAEAATAPKVNDVDATADDDGFDDFAEAPPDTTAAAVSSNADAVGFGCAGTLEKSATTQDDDFGEFDHSTQAQIVAAGALDADDGFGSFAETAPKDVAKAASTDIVKDDDDFGDDFGGFAEAPADIDAQDDDDFGGFADATPAADKDEDDDGFGSFGGDDSFGGGGDFDSFASAPKLAALEPPALTEQPRVVEPAATAGPGLLPPSVFDSDDPTMLKRAAKEALRQTLSAPLVSEATGVTGCLTLDQLLSSQQSLGQSAWNTSVWLVDAQNDSWAWSGSAIERSLLQSLGMPLLDTTAMPPAAAAPERAMPASVDGPTTKSQDAARSMPLAPEPTTSSAGALPHAPAIPTAPVATDDSFFSGFDGAVPPVPVTAPEPVTAPPLAPPVPPPTTVKPDDSFGDSFGDFTSISAFDAPQSSAPPLVAPSSSLSAALADDAFGDFGASSSAPPVAVTASAPPAAMPLGESLLDVDFSSLGGSMPTASIMPPPQMGMVDMLASLDPLSDAMPAASVAADRYDAWLNKLPNLSFILDTHLSRPQLAR